jgi:hypothetical protein
MFESIRNIFRKQTVQHIRIEGQERVTKIEYAGGIEKRTNSLVNAFDLLGYEIRSDTVEIFRDKKFLGLGYIADIAGITVDISRVLPVVSSVQDLADDDIIPSGLLVGGKAIFGALKPDWKTLEYRYVPGIVLSGKTRIESLKFVYLREISGAVIDDEAAVRYQVVDGTRIEIVMPDGKSGLGYICDSSGTTITIKRQVKLTAVKDGKVVEIEVNFSGRVGRSATSDNLSKLLSMVSGRENLMQLILVGLIANIIGVVLRI